MNMKPDITLYDVVTNATEAGEWVNGEFQAIVQNATQGQGNKPSKADLIDPDNNNISCAVGWFGGDFVRLSGSLCHFGGKGMKIKSYRGKPELTLGKETTVNIITAAPEPKSNSAATPPQGKPLSPGAAALSKDPSEQAVIFHRTMKKIALFYLHCDQYVLDIERKRGVLLPEQRQAAVASLFITGKDKGLLDIVPPARPVDDKGLPFAFVPPDKKPADPEAEAKAAAEAARVAELKAREQAAKRQAELDEDVPF